MRKQWFGDNRDYVKWSCVKAEAANTFAVVYGPMLRPDSHCGEKLDREVVRFFDKHKDFGNVAELFPAGFAYLPNVYSLDEAEVYFDKLQELIEEQQSRSPIVVFLDPDTGVEPRSKATNEHLRNVDVRRVCKLLRSAEKLIVYQHSSRNSGWQESKAQELLLLADEMEMELGEYYQEPNTAKDVCFFTFIKK